MAVVGELAHIFNLRYRRLAVGSRPDFSNGGGLEAGEPRLRSRAAPVGARGEAQRHAAWKGRLAEGQAVSPLPSAPALHNRRRWRESPAIVLASLALFAARLHGAVEVYVTDYLAPQDKAIKPLGGVRTNVARLFAAPGEFEPVSFALRPDERVDQLFLTATELVGPAGTIPRANVRVQSVEGFHGGDKDILMDLGHPWDMPAYQRELFWATVHVPAEAKPGAYSGEVTVATEGKPVARLALALEVLPVRLDEPPFALGFNYSSPKDPRALAAHLADLRAHGMTTVAPLYNFHLPVHDEDTREFGEFIEAFRRAGFSRPIYFGTSMNLLMSELAGYGPVDSRRFQRKFLQVMRRLHAEAQRHGVPVLFSIADELTNQALPGVRKGELLARLCFEELPEMAVTADMNGWLEVTTLAPFLNVATFNNGWDGIDRHNKGRRLINREFMRELQQKTDAIPWFVNAGSGRFPFGFFFWKMAKHGVRGKVEWYYNLGQNERGSVVRTEGERLWPTLAYERSREGIDDLKYLVTLERRLGEARQAGRASAAVSRAEALLKQIADSIVDNWTAYTDGGETFPSDGFEVMAPNKAAGLTHYQSVRRALAEAILKLQEARSTP